MWPRPNEAWQIDATSWALADGQTVWIRDVLDDHSGALVTARVDTGPTARAAWDAFTTAVQAWGLSCPSSYASCSAGVVSHTGRSGIRPAPPGALLGVDEPEQHRSWPVILGHTLCPALPPLIDTTA